MRRDIIRQFRFNKNENDMLKMKSAKCGITDSALVRLLIKGYVPKEKPDKELYNILKELSSIGNNLNQLTAKANSLNFIDTPMLNDLSRKITALYDEVFEKYLKSDMDCTWQ